MRWRPRWRSVRRSTRSAHVVTSRLGSSCWEHAIGRGAVSTPVVNNRRASSGRGRRLAGDNPGQVERVEVERRSFLDIPRPLGGPVRQERVLAALIARIGGNAWFDGAILVGSLAAGRGDA